MADINQLKAMLAARRKGSTQQMKLEKNPRLYRSRSLPSLASTQTLQRSNEIEKENVAHNPKLSLAKQFDCCEVSSANESILPIPVKPEKVTFDNSVQTTPKTKKAKKTFSETTNNINSCSRVRTTSKSGSAISVWRLKLKAGMSLSVQTLDGEWLEGVVLQICRLVEEERVLSRWIESRGKLLLHDGCSIGIAQVYFFDSHGHKEYIKITSERLRQLAVHILFKHGTEKNIKVNPNKWLDMKSKSLGISKSAFSLLSSYIRESNPDAVRALFAVGLSPHQRESNSNRSLLHVRFHN